MGHQYFIRLTGKQAATKLHLGGGDGSSTS